MNIVNLRINKYIELNSSFKKKMIFNFGHEAGFYSEFNNMILAIIYCLQNKIEFRIYSKYAKYCTKKGWEDFFLPFCDEPKNIFHKYFNRRRPIEKNNIMVFALKRVITSIFKLIFPNTYLGNEFWDEFHNRNMENMKFTFPQLGICGEDLQTTAMIIINIIYRFNSETLSEINNLINTINLPDKYVGFHIRRGDKYLEYQEIENDLYILKSKQICEAIKNAFVLTDDYGVIEELKFKFRDWNFYTLTNSNEKGYEYFSTINKSANERRTDMIKLFASMEILRKSNYFIGTYSSNPGMFMGMCMDKGNAIGVDLDKWQIW